MKHPFSITSIFIALFIVAQLVGLLVMNLGVTQVDTNTGSVDFADTAAGERPQLTGLAALAYIVFGVAIGTIILLFIAKKGSVIWWKIWFFLAVWISISITLGVLTQNTLLSWLLGFALAYLKLWKKNMWTHNISEILIYPGLAFFLVPLLDIKTVIFLLILISIYDAYAVWKSKHMVTMAKFTTKANIFPGFNINYDSKKANKQVEEKDAKKSRLKKKGKKTSGVLGGGDIAIPMLFIGVVFITLLQAGFSRESSLMLSSIIIVSSAVSLGLLLYYSKEKKFYPAMPFLSAGCIVGYVIVLLLI